MTCKLECGIWVVVLLAFGLQGPVFGEITVTAENHRDLVPGNFATTVVHVRNHSESPTVYRLRVSPPRGWELLSHPGEFTLGPGEDKDIFVTVGIPDSSQAGVYWGRLEVISARKVTEKQLKYSVKGIRGIELTQQNRPKLPPGGEGRVWIVISNTGNRPEKLLLEVEPRPGWKVDLGEDRAEVAPGCRLEIPVTVHLPEGEGEGPVGSAFILRAAGPSGEELGSLAAGLVILPPGPETIPPLAPENFSGRLSLILREGSKQAGIRVGGEVGGTSIDLAGTADLFQKNPTPERFTVGVSGEDLMFRGGLRCIPPRYASLKLRGDSWRLSWGRIISRIGSEDTAQTGLQLERSSDEINYILHAVDRGGELMIEKEWDGDELYAGVSLEGRENIHLSAGAEMLGEEDVQLKTRLLFAPQAVEHLFLIDQKHSPLQSSLKLLLGKQENHPRKVLGLKTSVAEILDWFSLHCVLEKRIEKKRRTGTHKIELEFPPESGKPHLRFFAERKNAVGEPNCENVSLGVEKTLNSFLRFRGACELHDAGANLSLALDNRGGTNFHPALDLNFDKESQRLSSHLSLSHRMELKDGPHLTFEAGEQGLSAEAAFRAGAEGRLQVRSNLSFPADSNPDWGLEFGLSESFSFPLPGNYTRGQLVGEIKAIDSDEEHPDWQGVVVRAGDTRVSVCEEGRFVFPPFSPGEYRISIEGLDPGYLAEDMPRKVSIGAGEICQIEIDVKRTGTIWGRIFLPGENEGLAGIGVKLKALDLEPTAVVGTDRNGYFRFRDVPRGSYLLQLNKESLPPGFLPDGPAAVDIVFSGQGKRRDFLLKREKPEVIITFEGGES